MTLLFVLAAPTWAIDSTELAKSRREALQKTSFYCSIGREPVSDSSETFDQKPNANCAFSGPFDTKTDPLSLQPPILNPLLTLSQLQSYLQSLKVEVTNSGGNLQFQIQGDSFSARMMNQKDLKDPLMHFKVYPSSWGDQFVVIKANRHEALRHLAQLPKDAPLFWANPHVEDEKVVRPRLQSNWPYRPISLLTRCQNLPQQLPQLLLVGDLHDPSQAEYYLSLIQNRRFAWAGVEFDERRDLSRLPANLRALFTQILQTLESQQTPIVYFNSRDEYLNYPYTNTGFHGLMMATRNKVWADHLPEKWEGTGIMLAGLDHFTNFPGNDFQDFALERFPNLSMTLINPLESCHSQRSAEPRTFWKSLPRWQ